MPKKSYAVIKQRLFITQYNFYLLNYIIVAKTEYYQIWAKLNCNRSSLLFRVSGIP